MFIADNIVDTDSYKYGHFLQVRPGTTSMFYYLSSRGGKYNATLQFGTRYILNEVLGIPITQEMIDEVAEEVVAHGLPFNREGWEYILHHHNGYLPVRVRAIQEGEVMPVHTPLMTVETTDPKVPWIGGHIETPLVRMWYPITVATQSLTLRLNIMHYLRKTSMDPEGQIHFKLHDFGSRGATCREQAALGGSSHAAVFKGSDTFVAQRFLKRMYDQATMPIFSIPASEHSTITSWGRENEKLAMENMITVFGGDGKMFACVSDSYNIFNAVDNIWGKELKQQVIDSGATVVIRPDSGDPCTMVMYCLESLGKNFGYVVNDKGYKVLNHVRVIQGDGVNPDSIIRILEAMTLEHWSTDNIAFGMGGALLQKMDRDTQKFAYKCSSITINGSEDTEAEEVDVFKDPVTDPGKKSQAGRLDVIRDFKTGEVRTVRLEPGQESHPDSIMRLVYENGTITKYGKPTFKMITDRVEAWFEDLTYQNA